MARFLPLAVFSIFKLFYKYPKVVEQFNCALTIDLIDEPI